MSISDGAVSSIDTEEAKAERHRHRTKPDQGTHIVWRMTEDGPRYVTEPTGPQQIRIATDRLARADKFHGSRDADRAAYFAGPEWEAIPLRQHRQNLADLASAITSAKGRHPCYYDRSLADSTSEPASRPSILSAILEPSLIEIPKTQREAQREHDFHANIGITRGLTDDHE